MSVSSISLVGWNELYRSGGRLAADAKKAGRNAVVVLLLAIGLFATANTVLMILIFGFRKIFGISNTMKSQSSKYLTKVHVKRKTPRVCIAITMLAAIIIVRVFEACLFLIAGVSVFCVLIVYRRIINITMISLRYQKNAQVRHLVSPISIEIFPLLPGLRIIFWIAISFIKSKLNILSYIRTKKQVNEPSSDNIKKTTNITSAITNNIVLYLGQNPLSESNQNIRLIHKQTDFSYLLSNYSLKTFFYLYVNLTWIHRF